MKHIVPLPGFERDIKKFQHEKKERLKNTLDTFNHFVTSDEKPFGFRFKKSIKTNTNLELIFA